MRIIAFLAAALLSISALAQTPPAPPRCDAAENRQFDFWIGDWRVESPDGKLLGRNTVSRDLANCVLVEHWRGEGGSEGKSFNLWDRATKRWHQTWVDASGGLLLLEGNLEGKSMRLEGKRPGPDGAVVRHRITWTPLDREDCRGCVRQFWESARGDEGWKPLFEGIYHPAGTR